MKDTIKLAKKLIDLPYNKFNLQNYNRILYENCIRPVTVDTEENSPIKLMSGKNFYSRIVTSNLQFISTPKIYLVGKGILFDSGGLDLKKEMNDMSCDKAGMIIALTVASFIEKNVTAYCPVTTNFVQDSLITPGDELSIGKKTVKITSTDAEGRLILAEALTLLKATEKDIVITIATLTGAVSRAIDNRATGVLGVNDELINRYLNSCKEVGEYAWRLPLFDYMQKAYNKKEIKNYNKDIKAGTSEAAMFLKQFVSYPERWIHLDIASSAFDKNGKANGVPIKSLIHFIEGLK
jgi:leucyl aminopeptidase